MKRELVKIVCVAVVLEHDDQGEVTGEIESQPTACYGEQQLVAFLAQARMEVDAWNAQQPNRAQRRRKPKEA